jgi:transcriptional regulator GlxA family with amidase domain
VRWQNRVVDIAIPLYEDFAALDAVGPYEVLSRLPGSEVHFVAKEAGPVRTETGMLSLNANRELSSLPSPEVIVVPGGIGNRALLEDEELLGWIARAHERTTWTTSVCTGSLLLGAAGVLDGLEATTYWLELETLRQFGATPSNQRVVEQGKVITAAGVSAGIDMALVLADHIAGADVAQAIQLGIEYDPKPPFDAGSPGKAPAHVVELVREVARAATRP